MEGIHELFGRWNAAEQGRYAVATLLTVEGHSYRKPGAVMLFDCEGPAAGSLSPGCLEADLTEHARTVIASDRAITVTYDMYDEADPMWGEAAFCGGSMTILVEPLTGAFRDAMLQLRYWMDRGHAVTFNRIMDHKGLVQAYRLTCEGGTSKRFGRVSRSFWTWSARYGPKPRLVVFGAGPDGQAVAELAGRAGFQVVLADWRGSVDGTADYDRAAAPLPELVEAAGLKRGDRVLLMSHHYPADRMLLEQLLPKPLRYIGILGSATRSARLLDGLVRKEDSRIHAPVGLSIGADGPEQIAVSIVGELIADWAQERKSKAPGPLLQRRQLGQRQSIRSCPSQERAEGGR